MQELKIPLYYGWEKYKEVLVSYFLSDAEENTVSYRDVAENVDISYNYVSSMSKWLSNVGLLKSEQKGRYTLSDIGLKIAEKMNHGLDYIKNLEELFLSSDALQPLFSFLMKNDSLEREALFRRVVILGGIKQVKSYHRRGIEALIEALKEAGILDEKDGTIYVHLPSDMISSESGEMKEPSLREENLAVLKNAFRKQGENLHYPTEIDGVFIVMIEDQGEMKPGLRIEIPALKEAIHLLNRTGLQEIRGLLNDQRIGLLLEYIERAQNWEIEDKGVFRL